MTQARVGPPPGQEGGPLADFQPNAPSQCPTQAKKRGARPPHLRLVPPASPPRVEVRIIAYERHVPRARSFQLTHRALDELIAHAERLGARA